MENEYPGYQKRIRKAILHYVALILGIHIKIDGIPYGSINNSLSEPERN